MKNAILSLANAMLVGAASASAQTTTFTPPEKLSDSERTLTLLGISFISLAVLRRYWRI